MIEALTPAFTHEFLIFAASESTYVASRGCLQPLCADQPARQVSAMHIFTYDDQAGTSTSI